MNGRTLSGGAVGLLLLLTGCVEQPSTTSEPVSANGSLFDAASAGTIQGQVTWTGEVPVVPPCRGWTDLSPDNKGATRQIHDNPNAPQIDPHSQGVAQAIVFLRGVDARQARPWDHPPVQVQQRDDLLHVLQGKVETHIGFVRRGDAVEIVSTDDHFHSLHAAGAAFFTLAFPDPGQPSRRTLDQDGLIELTSAAGYFWMRAYLFVDDHPYYTRTDAEGHFTLPQVPPGRYEVVCWLPSWREASHERDPETALVVRLHFRPPTERIQHLDLHPAETSLVHFTLSGKDF